METDLFELLERLALLEDSGPVPCQVHDAELWFSSTPGDVELAKTLCVTCPAAHACLAHALDHKVSWGVWGGELFEWGALVPRKRPRGRPRKVESAA